MGLRFGEPQAFFRKGWHLSGSPPRPASSGKEGGPREGEGLAGFLSLRMWTDASS